MTAAARHTPEPWKVVTLDGVLYINPDRESGEYRLIAKVGDPEAYRTNKPANAARIVACVNACAGMEDPEAEIAELRVDLKAAQDHALECQELHAEADAGWVEAETRCAMVESRLERLTRAAGAAYGVICPDMDLDGSVADALSKALGPLS